jgi:3-oxoacyl-[acyl-carrier protein] reductase
MMDFRGKVVIVTGSTRGIGHEIALHLAELGAKVVVSSRKAEDCARVEAEFSSKQLECLGLAADVSSMEDCKALANAAIERFGQVDILVNNAGITMDNLLMRMKEEQWDDIMNINLKSVFNMSQTLLRNFLKLRGGRIINITSTVGQMGNAGQANYAASKAGIIGFTKSLAREVGSRGITVNAVAPGYIATDMTDAIADEAKEKLFSQIPLGRIGEPKDVANLVAFLGSDEAGYITGQVFNVDGGLVMQG